MSILEINNNDCSEPAATSSEHGKSSLRFVLVETSRPGNIGATARAMKTMGYSKLVLVRPRFPIPAQELEAIAFASGALDVLQAALVTDSMDEALEGCNYVAAVSARLREFSPPVMAPRAWAAGLADSMNGSDRCHAALVFGNERFGLPNEIVEKCNVLINIPANPAYSSLNLAQAVQIMAYECSQANCFASDNALAFRDEAKPVTAMEDQPDVPGKVGFYGQLADKTQIDAMFSHLEQAFVAIDFLDPDHPKRLMSRMRRLFARTGLETEEVNILRGIASHILKRRG